MDKVKTLHDEIISKVKEYYRCCYGEKKAFEPGVDKVNYAGRVFDEQEMTNLVDSALEFWLTAGRYANMFEKRFADMLGVEHALLVNSGSSANLLAFMALTSPLLGERRILPCDEVITVACGFPTTVAPIVQYGAVPVFVDVDVATANIIPEQLEIALSKRTKAVMIAHTLGNPFDLRAVSEFCRKHGLFLIEDNCDALGSKLDGRFTGTWGDIGTSSFYPPHHLTMGEGGAVYTSDPLLFKILKSMRDWGRDCHCDSGRDNACGCRFNGQFGTLPFGYDHKYVYSHFGYNLKATEMQAAIGVAQLEKLEGFTAARRANFEYLKSKLSDIPALQLFEAIPGAEPSWFGFLMTIKTDCGFDRNEFSKFLEQNKIQTRNLFAGNLTRHPCFESLVPDVDYRIAVPLINTDIMMNNSVWVGVYPGMTVEHLDYMAEKIVEFFRRG